MIYYTLSINTTHFADYDGYALINRGTIIVRQVGNGETILSNCGLKIYGTQEGNVIYNSTLKNHGTINNIGGIIYIDERGGNLLNYNTSTVIGTGDIFTWSGGMFNSVENNNLYVRAPLSSDSIELEESVFDYALGAEIKPTVKAIKYNSQSLNMSDYTITYEDNINAGLGKVIVTPIDQFDRYFIKGLRTFVINKIVGELNSSTKFNEINSINYSKYILTKNLTLTQDVTYPNNIIIDYGDYRINTNGFDISIGATTKIWVNINSSNISSFSSVRAFADKIN